MISLVIDQSQPGPGPKKIDQVGRGGQGRSKYGPECASSCNRNGLNLASEPSLGPEMGQGPQKWTQINQGQLGGQFRFHSIYLGSL